MKKQINLESAEVGMILARAVTDEKGLILCAEGTTVSDNILDLLKRRMINTIFIESDATISQSDYADLKQSIEKRFAAVGNPDCLLGKLKTVMLESLEFRKGG